MYILHGDNIDNQGFYLLHGAMIEYLHDGYYLLGTVYWIEFDQGLMMWDRFICC